MASLATNRSSAIRISISNHKGGVGKTTLTYNVASQMASMGKRVLLVDADPQCNLTAYVIDGEVLDDLLDTSDDEDGRTVWSALKPVVEAVGAVKSLAGIELGARLFLFPGDIRLSDFEEELSDLWRQCFQRKRRGLVGTSALSAMVNIFCKRHRIDYVFYDSSPSIGPLNRAILLDCDYFIIPAAYDLFSVRALKTLGRTLYSWIEDWNTIRELSPADAYILPGRPKFLGYIPQNFTVYRGGVASQQRKYLGLLDKSINTEIVSVLRPLGVVPNRPNYRIGEIKDFGTLVTASQREGVPIYSVHAGTSAQRRAAREAFHSIANKIVALTE